MAIDTVLETPVPDAGATEVYAHLLSVLGDRTRLTIVQHLALGPHRVRDLVEHLGLAQSTTSKHLGQLREHGLVDVRTEGRASWFSLSHPGELGHVLAATQALLRRTGSAVTLCSHLVDGAAAGGAGARGAAPDRSAGTPVPTGAAVPGRST